MLKLNAELINNLKKVLGNCPSYDDDEAIINELAVNLSQSLDDAEKAYSTAEDILFETREFASAEDVAFALDEWGIDVRHFEDYTDEEKTEVFNDIKKLKFVYNLETDVYLNIDIDNCEPNPDF